MTLFSGFTLPVSQLMTDWLQTLQTLFVVIFKLQMCSVLLCQCQNGFLNKDSVHYQMSYTTNDLSCLNPFSLVQRLETFESIKICCAECM